LRTVKLFLPLLLTMLTIGCCVRRVTNLHNVTGRNVILTVVRDGGHKDSIALRPGSSTLIDDFIAAGRPVAWVVADSEVHYTFSDISAFEYLPSRHVSSSRFTSDFPCRRITRWIALVPKDELWAARFSDPTDEQPLPFPLRPSKKASVR
jgi:hypothetical protein